MILHDITRTLSPTLAVWPGDQPFERRWTARIEDGSPVNIGAMLLTTHAGTHADAPLHFLPEGAGIHEVPLLHFIGKCRVIHIEEDATGITPGHVQRADLRGIRRVLFRTRSSLVEDRAWNPDLVPILPQTVDALAALGVVLVGTDAPSVDPADSETLPAHKALARHGIVNLENLMLRDVAEGIYRLVALPLKLEGLDASPVRAVLMAV